MPALAIVTVCCSITCGRRSRRAVGSQRNSGQAWHGQASLASPVDSRPTKPAARPCRHPQGIRSALLGASAAHPEP